MKNISKRSKIIALMIILVVLAKADYGYPSGRFQNNFYTKVLALNNTFTLKIYKYTPILFAVDIFPYTASANDLVNVINNIGSIAPLNLSPETDYNLFYQATYSTNSSYVIMKIRWPQFGLNTQTMFVTPQNIQGYKISQEPAINLMVYPRLMFNSTKYNLVVKNPNPCSLVVQFTCQNFNQFAYEIYGEAPSISMNAYSCGVVYLYPPGADTDSQNYVQSFNLTKDMQREQVKISYPGNWTLLWKTAQFYQLNSVIYISIEDISLHPDTKQYCWNDCTLLALQYLQYITFGYGSNVNDGSCEAWTFQGINRANNIIYYNCSFIFQVQSISFVNDKTLCRCEDATKTYSYGGFCSNLCSDVINGNLQDKSNVVQGCTCQDKFYWNSNNRTCQINCSLFLGTTFPATYYNRTMCVCIDPKKRWDPFSFKCVLDCRTVTHSTYKFIAPSSKNNNYNDMMSCPCENGYLWNETARDCLACSNDPNINWTVPVLEPSSCNCNIGYIWIQTNNKCIQFCSQFPNTNLTFLSNSNDNCYCLNNLIWNSTLRQCIRDCSNTPNVNQTQISTDTAQCVCMKGYIWSSLQNSCILNCYLIAYVDNNYFETTKVECPCLSGFYWDSTDKVCRKNCSAILNTDTSKISSLVNQCVCQSEYYWNATQNQCRRNCSLIINANTNTNQLPVDPSSCICNLNTIWNISTNSCTSTCYTFENVNTTKITVNTLANQCPCIDGFYWNVNVCQRNCSNIQYAIASQVSPLSTQCICLNNFYWSASQNICKKNKKLAASNDLIQQSNQSVHNDQSINKTLIIVLSIIGGLFVIIVLAAIIYKNCKHKKQLNKQEIAQSAKAITVTEEVIQQNEVK